MTDVTFWDACRFANWLNNGQPSGAQGAGTTETGAYTLTTTGITNNTVIRNAGATWAVTNENEWYKAAYYDPSLNAGAGGYWFYPMLSNSISTAQANYYDSGINDTTDVGSYSYPSYYGTFDQCGNVWQYNEAIITTLYRGDRGASFGNFGNYGLRSTDRDYIYSQFTTGTNLVGFRVSQVPEPASLGILSICVIGMLVRRPSARSY